MNHVIQKSRLQIKVRDKARAYEIQSQVIQLFQERVLPLLEQELDRWVPADRVVQVDRLDLDIGTIPLSQLEHDFPRLVAEQFAKQLPGLSLGMQDGQLGGDEAAVREATASSSMLDTLIRFLRTGRVGWEQDSLSPGPTKWLTALLKDVPETLRTALATVMDEPSVAERLSLQFPQELKRQVLSLMQPDASNEPLGIIEDALAALRLWSAQMPILPQSPSSLRAAVEAAALRHSGSTSSEILASALRSLALARSWLLSSLEASLAGLSLAQLVSMVTPIAKDVTRLADPRVLSPGSEAGRAMEEILRTQILGFFHIGTPVPDVSLAGIGVEVDKLALGSRSSLRRELLRALGGRKTTAAGHPSPTPPVSAVPESKPAVSASKPRQQDSSTSLFAEDTSLYVQNAGLVLLNPFLQPCFEELGWMERGAFLSEEAQEDAVLFTAYLACGELEISEARLPLAKLLCGMALNRPVRSLVDLPDPALVEADTLLTAANEHWKRAGKLSPAQFREAFLMREGRLDEQGAGWSLKVDRHTIDILLEFLPWSFGTIKLPWMSGLLSVDW